jgi:hypothetical protein
MKRGPSAIYPAAEVDGEEVGSGHHSLRHRIRGLERLLARPGLAVQAHKDKSRLLRKLRQQQGEKRQQAREARYAERYKAVRFYEQRKAERRLKAARKAAQEAGGEAGAGAARAASCEEDVAYVKWFPRHLRYVALYADPAKSADNKLLARRAALRAWALANAAAGTYLLSPPGDAPSDGAVDDEPETEDEVEAAAGRAGKEGGGGRAGGGAGGGQGGRGRRTARAGAEEEGSRGGGPGHGSAKGGQGRETTSSTKE